MKTTAHTMLCAKQNARAVLVADFHDGDPAPLLEEIRALAPDLILVAGDVVHHAERAERGLALLRALITVAPVFCSLGNHECRCENVKKRIRQTGARLLDNAYTTFGGLVIGGLSSGYEGKKQGRLKCTPPPDKEWLADFCAEEGTHVLLSHHPEYYPRFLRDYPIELILSGHAHGGQWCFLGRGLFAPGQGMLPRFTHGAYRGRRRVKTPLALSAEKPILVVSRGLSNEIGIPRIGNPEELVVLDFVKEEA